MKRPTEGASLPEAKNTKLEAQVTEVVEVFDGVCIPCMELRGRLRAEKFAKDSAPPLVIFGHGRTNTKNTDRGITALTNSLNLLSEQRPDSAIPRAVVYDARGRGESKGWELGGPAQFHWRCMGVDMLQVAVAWRSSPSQKILLGGNSMGASAAIWAALLSPRTVAGLILFQVPIAWEDRAVRRITHEKAAEAKHATEPIAAEVLLGAARSDLPLQEELKVVDVPVLIASARDDPIHPIASAEALTAIWPKSTLIVTEKKADLPDTFSKALVRWMDSIDL